MIIASLLRRRLSMACFLSVVAVAAVCTACQGDATQPVPPKAVPDKAAPREATTQVATRFPDERAVTLRDGRQVCVSVDYEFKKTTPDARIPGDAVPSRVLLHDADASGTEERIGTIWQTWSGEAASTIRWGIVGVPNVLHKTWPEAAEAAYDHWNGSMIPNDLAYSVTQTEVIAGGRAHVASVRISKRMSEGALQSVASKVKASDSRVLSVLYRLPEMDAPGKGIWARATFAEVPPRGQFRRADLEVKILGTSTEEDARLSSVPKDANRDIVGAWMVQETTSRITIYRQSGKVFAEEVFKDTSRNTDELIEKPDRRFDHKIDPNPADRSYWIIDQAGNLQMRDKTGLILTAKKILR